MKVRTRFAPSPTGYLHVGGIRTALFAWLVARQADGQFILRIEDTDRNRHVAEAEAHIMESLQWLGLQWDEGPIRQSERLGIYQEWAQKLIAKGRAYADPYTREQVEEFRQRSKNAKKPFKFRDYRPEKLPEWDGSQPLRFKSSEVLSDKIRFTQDLVMGGVLSNPSVSDDFVLIKSDGYPTYNFAHIVDDYLMDITHVIRSQEFVSSFGYYKDLYDALDIQPPLFATLPYVMALDGNKKLSKRDGAKDILEYRAEGYMPEALANFLATLGWNDGTEQEIFSREELIEKFSLDRVQRHPARFDERRLLWMNGHYIRELPLEKLAELAKDYWPAEAKDSKADYQNQVLQLVQERLKFLAEVPDLTWFFFREPTGDEIKSELVPEGKVVDIDGKKFDILKGNKANPMHIEEVISSLSDSDFTEIDIKNRLNNLLSKLDTTPAILFSEVRGAVTGSRTSPQLFGTLAVLGKEKSLARLQKASDLLAKSA